MSSSEPTSEPKSDQFVWENRRLYPGLGWRQPVLFPTWVCSKGGLPAGRPSTKAYRKVEKGLDLDGPEWDWCIRVDENTDEEGWTYGGCGFWELQRKRLASRNRARRWDYVRRRKWVHRGLVQLLISNQRGNQRFLDPKELYRSRLEAQKTLDEAKAAIWDLVEELDNSVKIKDLYTALLDPIALNRVANRHIKVMLREQNTALHFQQPATLPEQEVWPEGVDPEVKPLDVMALQTSESSSLIGVAPSPQSVSSHHQTSESSDLIGVAPSPQPVGSHHQGMSRSSSSGVLGGERAGLLSAFNSSQHPCQDLDQPSECHSQEHRIGQCPQEGMNKTLKGLTSGNHRIQLSLLSSSGRHQADIQPSSFNSAAMRQFSEALPEAVSKDPLGPSEGLARSLSHQPLLGVSKGVQLLRQGARSFLDRTIKAFNMGGGILGGGILGGVGGSDENGPTTAVPSMTLSMHEMQCACGHALGIYGDLDKIIDGLPAQTFCEAITKFSGVPKSDVLMVNWRSEPFKPAFYLAVDRLARKIVICIRGTVGHADLITDFMCRPVEHEFSPMLKGHVHAGILQSAQYVIDQVWEKLQEALANFPSMPIFVTGHSLGGSTACLIAILLRNDTRLLMRVSVTVRAVCLGPATATDLKLAVACRDFVATVVHGADVIPRTSVHAFSAFVHEVAKASAIKQMILSIKSFLFGQARKGLCAQYPAELHRLFVPGTILWIIKRQGKQRIWATFRRSNSILKDQSLRVLNPPSVKPWSTLCQPSVKPQLVSLSIQQQQQQQQIPSMILTSANDDIPVDPSGLKRPEAHKLLVQEAQAQPPNVQNTVGVTPSLVDVLLSKLNQQPPEDSRPLMRKDSSAYEIRVVEQKSFSKILFFKKSLADHYSTAYLESIRGLISGSKTQG